MPDVIFAFALAAVGSFAATYLVGQYLRWRGADEDDMRREVERDERRVATLNRRNPLSDEWTAPRVPRGWE